MTIKCIVAGSRDFNDYVFLCNRLDYYFSKADQEIIIVSGAARGADKLGEDYARSRKLSVKEFPADWDKHGRSAGYKRNVEMAQYASHCICFWDGISRGTKHMIDISRLHSLNLRICKY